jgi:hypothetical protein
MDAISIGHTEPVYLIGYAANRVLYQAFCDSGFDPEKAGEVLSDEDLSPYYMDASYLSSVAAAGGFPSQKEADPAKRLEFWEWWLSEAVPQAWDSVPEQGNQ